jgi:hypothetical protein
VWVGERGGGGRGTFVIPLAIVSPNNFEKLVVFSFTIFDPILGSSNSVLDLAMRNPNPCFMSSSSSAAEGGGGGGQHNER